LVALADLSGGDLQRFGSVADAHLDAIQTCVAGLRQSDHAGPDTDARHGGRGGFGRRCFGGIQPCHAGVGDNGSGAVSEEGATIHGWRVVAA